MAAPMPLDAPVTTATLSASFPFFILNLLLLVLLRSPTAELVRVKRHRFPDAHRWPAGHALHAVRHPVIPTRPVQLGHRHQMMGQVLRQLRVFEPALPIL